MWSFDAAKLSRCTRKDGCSDVGRPPVKTAGTQVIVVPREVEMDGRSGAAVWSFLAGAAEEYSETPPLYRVLTVVSDAAARLLSQTPLEHIGVAFRGWRRTAEHSIHRSYAVRRFLAVQEFPIT